MRKWIVFAAVVAAFSFAAPPRAGFDHRGPGYGFDCYVKSFSAYGDRGEIVFKRIRICH